MALTASTEKFEHISLSSLAFPQSLRNIQQIGLIREFEHSLSIQCPVGTLSAVKTVDSKLHLLLFRSPFGHFAFPEVLGNFAVQLFDVGESMRFRMDVRRDSRRTLSLSNLFSTWLWPSCSMATIFATISGGTCSAFSGSPRRSDKTSSLKRGRLHFPRLPVQR